MTLDEIKAAAAQVGIDPSLVERAARLVSAEAAVAPSLAERIAGGRIRYGAEAQFPVVLDEAGAARLMSAIRIAVGQPGEGHSSALGLTWRSSDDGGAVLSLTAQTDAESTLITAQLDRRGTLAVVASMAAVGSVMGVLLGGTLANAFAPGFEVAGALLGSGTVLAAARGYWVSSADAARTRLHRVMDSVSRFVTTPGDTTPARGSVSPAAGEADATDEAS